MMAKPMKTLKLHYPMIQILTISDIPSFCWGIFELVKWLPCYNPPINFRVILLATLRHVMEIAGQLSRKSPRPRRYLSSDCFRRRET